MPKLLLLLPLPFKAIFIQNVTANKMIFIISCYFVFVFNLSFLFKTYNAVLLLDNYNLFFVLSVPVLLLNLLMIFFSVFSVKYLLKPSLIIFTFISALIAYATISYGIVFDYGMIENIIETSSSEAFSYLNITAFFSVAVLSILPIIYLYNSKISYKRFKIECIQRLKLISLSVLSIFFIAFFFYADYASVGRNNRELTSYITPLKSVVSSYKFVRNNYFNEPVVFTILDNTPVLLTEHEEGKRVILMVVGETARAENFSLNGYDKPTNQFTRIHNPISFKHMSSCGTATAVSVPCMFSSLGRNEYQKQTAKNQQNLLDIVKLANVDVLWLDNNEGCKGACKRVTTINTDKSETNNLCDGDYCFDEILLLPLKNKLANLTHQTTLIVLHLIGSHGPTYYRRYPAEFSSFLPDCQRSDIQNCSQEQIINTYDNTITYSDYVLSKMIEELSLLEEKNNVETSMLYVSDHGESLGEKGLYLHGFPYALAPSQQTHIPMLFWTNNKSEINHHCLNNLANNTFTHDNVFHSVLGLTKIKSKVYNPNLDIFHQCDTHDLLVKNS
ncbi:MAG: lipid A ethanolaminephosphotransferase [Colwellia sp.]|jgi:lipid A ethanolaminephosphotransferase